MLCVRDRALIGKSDEVGKGYIHLDSNQYENLLPRDVWLDFDDGGRLLLRISMEGEKDDIGFYFGRAFRSLKRAESEMVKIFVDKVGAVFTDYEKNTEQAA